MITTTNGRVTHVYIGGTRVKAAADGTFDPIKVALAKLRYDGRRDIAEIMAKFRRDLNLRSFSTPAWWL